MNHSFFLLLLFMSLLLMQTHLCDLFFSLCFTFLPLFSVCDGRFTSFFFFFSFLLWARACVRFLFFFLFLFFFSPPH